MSSHKLSVSPTPSEEAPGPAFGYEEAFSRNIGWITEWEQAALEAKKVAIAGLGGVGGVHLLTLARLGIGAFHIADPDKFELVNFNRQVGATLSTIGKPKVEVMAATAHDINPGLELTSFADGVDEANVDAFLDGVDLFVDGLDFFALDIRAHVFARCAELGIPAITAAPLGMGVAYLVFMPGGMTFEEYFRLTGLPRERQYVNFLVGLNPKGYHRAYLVDPSRVDLAGRRGPSTAMACQLCAGVVGAEAVKVLLGRGRVRAAPRYHQFDAYRGKWVSGWLPGGNRNPLQAVKRHIGYRAYARLSQAASPRQTAPAASEIERVLDLARWAPSGDNAQPWRFEIIGDDRVTVHVSVDPQGNVYEYNDGQPTLLSAGFLLETMRIAASRFGRMLWWRYRGASGHDHVIDVALPKTPGIEADPLLSFVTVRSVDRRRYRMTPLTPAQKRALEACIGDELEIRWYESARERWAMASINALATDIRLSIPEAYRVHRRILDWERSFSPDGVPAGAVGLSPMTRMIMRRVMRSWPRVRFMNRFLGGTVSARIEMDLVPGLACAAHFTVARKAPPEHADEVPSLLRAGEALQRLWLTATRMGLVMQPALAPLCFAHYGRHEIAFTGDDAMLRKTAALAARIARLAAGDPEDLVFAGRVGWPLSRAASTRSVRRPLPDLIVPATSDAR